MNQLDLTFFTAGHGLYHFHIDHDTFERSLFYNLLLQPYLAVPDHFFVQGTYVHYHLSQRKSRDTWLETALNNGFIIPFFREEHASLRKTLSEMRSTDLKGFTVNAENVADRLDGVYSKKEYWDPKANSEKFRLKFERIFEGIPPILPRSGHIDPWNYVGFWERSKEWRQADINMARDLATDKEVLPLSLLIQATAYRLLGKDTESIVDVRELLNRLIRAGLSDDQIRDVTIFYTLACEYYNRALAESVLAAANSPKWYGYLAALDLHSSEETLPEDKQEIGDVNVIETSIELPVLGVLKKTSGDCLLKIREHPAAERYFGTLAAWKANPDIRQAEILTAELKRYSEVIRKKVGYEVSTEQLLPRFLTRFGGIFEFVEKIPASYLLVVSAYPGTPNLIKTTALLLFCLRCVQKHRLSPKRLGLMIKANESGVVLGPDTTLLKKDED